MNLLIVDDEYYTVQNIRVKLDWESLGFRHIDLAYSMAEAQAILTEKPIHLMISDIEMPRGSGLDLLAWVYEQGLPTVCILLTCYARFDYASKALKLNSSDYLLKPIHEDELLSAVNNAIAKVRTIERDSEVSVHAEYWRGSQTKLAEQFWRDLALGVIPSEQDAIAAELAGRHLPLNTGGLWRIMLLEVTRTQPDEWEPNIYEYAIKNIWREVTQEQWTVEGDDRHSITTLSNNLYLSVFPSEHSLDVQVATVCRKSLEAFTGVLPGRFVFVCGEECAVGGLDVLIIRMQQAIKEYIRENSCVIDITGSVAGRSKYPEPPLEQWSELLITRKKDILLSDIRRYLSHMKSSDAATRSDLVVFRYSLNQIIFTMMERKNINARVLFDMPKTDVLSERSCNSIREMEVWADHIITTCLEYCDELEQSYDPIERVKRYIQENLSEELTREMLAQTVHLSPDYLTHLFSEKNGISLSGYVAQERIREAKIKLLDHSCNIGDVALLCGFQTISYFSKQFKKVVGKSPKQYRKEHHNK